MRHRLTALVASLVLLPSLLFAGAADCVVGERERTGAAPHGAHHHDAGAHAPSDVAADETHDHGPADHLPGPAECAAVMACGFASDVVSMTSLDDPPHATDLVVADAALTPDSPARGVEPPPPRG